MEQSLAVLHQPLPTGKAIVRDQGRVSPVLGGKAQACQQGCVTSDTTGHSLLHLSNQNLEHPGPQQLQDIRTKAQQCHQHYSWAVNGQCREANAGPACHFSQRCHAPA